MKDVHKNTWRIFTIFFWEKIVRREGENNE